jgi:Sperm-tail PG-rich repeat
MDMNSSSKLGEKKSSIFNMPIKSSEKYPALAGNSIFTQSATSLTRSVITWSFPRARRFRDIKISTKDVPLLDLGSTLSKSSTSLGFGRRHAFRPVDTPGPSITHREFPNIKQNSNAFNNTGNFNRESWDTHKDIPGPGSYEIERGFVRDNKGVSIKSRCISINPLKTNPGPNYYTPATAITERNRYSAIAFGSSKRYDFTKSVSQKNPGPGTYDIISPFEKKTREFKIKEDQKKNTE